MSLLVAVYTNKRIKSAEIISVVFASAAGFMSKSCTHKVLSTSNTILID